MWYIQTVEYYSAVKGNEIVPFADMDGPRDYHTQKLKEKYCLYVDSGKMVQMNLYRNRDTDKLIDAKERGGMG